MAESADRPPAEAKTGQAPLVIPPTDSLVVVSDSVKSAKGTKSRRFRLAHKIDGDPKGHVYLGAVAERALRHRYAAESRKAFAEFWKGTRPRLQSLDHGQLPEASGGRRPLGSPSDAQLQTVAAWHQASPAERRALLRRQVKVPRPRDVERQLYIAVESAPTDKLPRSVDELVQQVAESTGRPVEDVARVANEQLIGVNLRMRQKEREHPPVWQLTDGKILDLRAAHEAERPSSEQAAADFEQLLEQEERQAEAEKRWAEPLSVQLHPCVRWALEAHGPVLSRWIHEVGWQVNPEPDWMRQPRSITLNDQGRPVVANPDGTASDTPWEWSDPSKLPEHERPPQARGDLTPEQIVCRLLEMLLHHLLREGSWSAAPMPGVLDEDVDIGEYRSRWLSDSLKVLLQLADNSR